MIKVATVKRDNGKRVGIYAKRVPGSPGLVALGAFSAEPDDCWQCPAGSVEKILWWVWGQGPEWGLHVNQNARGR